MANGTFGSGTQPFFSGNPQSGYPVPPENWSRLHNNMPLQPQTDTSAHCTLPKIDGKQISDKYDSLFQKYAQKHHVNWLALKAAAAVESGPNFDAKGAYDGSNPYGVGIMGINSKAHPDFNYNTYANDADTNIDMGAKVMAGFVQQYGNTDNAYAHYLGFGSASHAYSSTRGCTAMTNFVGYFKNLLSLHGVNVNDYQAANC